MSTKTLFVKMTQSLVDSRLRLKNFGPNTTILEESELMDSIMIVLSGHVNVLDSKTNKVICSYTKD